MREAIVFIEEPADANKPPVPEAVENMPTEKEPTLEMWITRTMPIYSRTSGE